jgi:hypothetical protein
VDGGSNVDWDSTTAAAAPTTTTTTTTVLEYDTNKRTARAGRGLMHVFMQQ